MLETVKSKGTVPDGYSPTLPITDPWYSDILSPAFELATRHLPEGEKYDVLVVDEGQDILNLHYITALDNLLKNGFENGVWRMFYDPVNQGAIYRNIDLDVVQMLKGYGPVPPRLRVNCRNTDPIVLMTKLMTGAEPGTQSVGAGPAVQPPYHDGAGHAARLLESYLQSLSEKGISDSEITILSPLTFEESNASTLSRKWIQRIVPLRNTSADSFPNSRLTFSTIADFKGLENRFIALTDIEAMDSAASVALLYVGMTRARVKLWVAMNVQLKASQEEIIAQNISRLME